MQPHLARVRQRRRRTWQRRRLALVCGVALGVLQLALIAAAGLSQTAINFTPGFLSVLLGWWPFVVAGTLLYLLIPALMGFLTSRQRGDETSGTDAGCLAGGIGFLVLTSATLVVLILVFTTPQPPPNSCPSCGHGLGPYIEPAGFAVGLVLTLLFLEGLAALFGSAVGGSIGGWLGRRRASTLSQSSATLQRFA